MAKQKEAAEVKEKALSPTPGIGFGGLGDVSEAALLEAAKQGAAEKGSATGQEIRDAMGNVRPSLELVKVKGHGANIFQFPDEKKVDGNEGLLGIIVAYTRSNSWFGGKEFGASEPGELPACFSNDGETLAAGSASPQASACSRCTRNRDARDGNARDAAFKRLKAGDKGNPDVGRDSVCNNYLHLAVALPGRDLPVRVRFTRQTFKAWASYVQRIGTVEGRYLPHEVVTRIKLENHSGDFGEFSVGTFTFCGALPKEMRDQFKKQGQDFKAILQRAAEVDEQEDTTAEARQAMAEAKAAANAPAQEAGL